MSWGVNPTGFLAKPLRQILQELELEERARIDENLDTSTSEPIGQLNGIYAEALAKLWEHGQAIYSAGTRAGASGFALDFIGALTGSRRRGATKSLVSVDLTINATTTVPAGVVFAVDGDASARFVLTADAENPGASPAVIEAVAEAEVAGPVRANAGTLTVIVTPASGLTAVTNPTDAALGRIAESDDDFRRRQVDELAGLGTCTADSLRVALTNVSGVISARVIENVTESTVDGILAGGIEAVIYDGSIPAADDDEVAQAIWDNRAQATALAGSESGTATDSEGEDRTIAFSRADIIDVFLEVDVRVNPAVFPANGAALMEEALASFGQTTQAVGGDVVISRFVAPAYSIPGVLDVVEIRAGSVSPPAASNLSIGAREVAAYDTGRTTVTVL